MFIFKPATQVIAVGPRPDRAIGYIIALDDRRKKIEKRSADELRIISYLLSGTDQLIRSDLFEELLEEGFIEEIDATLLSALQKSALSREASYLNTYFPLDIALDACNTLESKRVAIVGLGGIGTHLLENLVRKGLRNFTLVDPDIVDQSNLNRQISYKPQDVGSPKISVASYHANSISRKPLKINSYGTIDDFLAALDNLRLDTVFVSADNAPLSIRDAIIRMLYPRRIGYVFIGYVGNCVFLDPLVFNFRNGCGFCEGFIMEASKHFHRIWETKCGAIPPSSYANNAIGAAIAVDQWARSQISGVSTDFTMKFSIEKLSAVSEPLQSNPFCPVCGRHDG